MNRSLLIPLVCISLYTSLTSLSAQTTVTTTTAPALRGELQHHTFDQSKIFPGTTREYWVYVPAEYDGAKPACLFVDQDRIQFNAPAVFDRLIDEKRMPVTIAVFVAPGRLPATSPDVLDRFNRSYEFDSLGDEYVRFLIDELLPEVEKQTTKDGRAIKISKDGNDRAIGGSSSGAIAAFTVAWERSDSFTRVFSAIGTYVGLRGGSVYPTLIRKFEPKPIRIYLQDGSNDNNHYGGDWWMANQTMERAFVFSGYEVEHVWGTGKHEHKQADEIFPEAMAWLWKDWPAPVKKGLGSEKLREILIPGEDWQLVSEGYGGSDGPAVNAAGEVFFSTRDSKTLKIGLDGKVTTFQEGSKNGGESFGPDGRLYAVSGTQILAFDASGKSSVISDGFKGNDLVVRPDNSMYVTESGSNTSPSKIWFIDPKGQKKEVDSGLKFANGVALSPDQSLLYVDDYRSHWVYSYQIQPDGSLAHKQKFYDLYVREADDDSAADGMRVDRDGRLYVTTRAGIQICDQAGRVNCIVPTPNGKVSNLTFGDEGFHTLFATCGDKVYKRTLKVAGANAFEKPFKPAPPKL